eukprot:3372076-Prymnesium_polylepis.1
MDGCAGTWSFGRPPYVSKGWFGYCILVPTGLPSHEASLLYPHSCTQYRVAPFVSGVFKRKTHELNKSPHDSVKCAGPGELPSTALLQET